MNNRNALLHEDRRSAQWILEEHRELLRREKQRPFPTEAEMTGALRSHSWVKRDDEADDVVGNYSCGRCRLSLVLAQLRDIPCQGKL